MYIERRDYYSVAGVPAEEIIDSMNMLHREGAAVKYLFRSNNVLPKGNIKKDMKKCRHYLARCLQYPAPIRDNSADYWIDQINPEVFNEDIYLAIVHIITAVGDGLAIYDDEIYAALEHVNNVIDRY